MIELCYSCGRRIVSGVPQCLCKRPWKLKADSRSGPLAWLNLHRLPFLSENWEPAELQRRLDRWLAREVPTNCDCVQKWLKLKQRFRPPLGDRREFFEWTVDRHNDINRDLEKPQFALARAWLLYGRIMPGPVMHRIISVYSHECIQHGPAVSEPPAEPVRCDVVIPFCSVDAIYLRDAVESILAQQHAAPVVHVVADGCEFPSLPSSPAIRRYRAEGGCGPYRITNALWPHFETDFIAIQDSDDISTPDRLWKQIQTLERFGYDMVSGGMTQFVAGDCASDSYCTGLAKSMPRLYSGMCWSASPRGAMINSVKTMRRSLFERLNGFAPWLMSADHEWDNRCAFAGAKLYHATDIFGRRRLHNRSLSNGVFPHRHKVRQELSNEMAVRIGKQEAGEAASAMGGGLGSSIIRPAELTDR